MIAASLSATLSAYSWLAASLDELSLNAVIATVLLTVSIVVLRLYVFGGSASVKREALAGGGQADLERLDVRNLPPGRKLEMAIDPPHGLQWSNPEEPFFFENDLCAGHFLFFHAPTDHRAVAGAGGVDYAEYFRGKTRLWELRIQFRLKRAPPSRELFFGIELENYVYLSAAAKRTVQLSITAIRQAVGGVYQTPGDDPATCKEDELEKPTIVLPLWAFDQFVITPPGEQPPDLTSRDFPEYGSRRKGRIAEYVREMNELTQSMGPGPVYTLAFWGNSRFLDVLGWKLRGIPIVTPYDFEPLMGDPPIWAVLYALQPGDIRHSETEKRHLPSRKNYLFRAAIWNSERRIAQSLFERLTGLRPEASAKSKDKEIVKQKPRGLVKGMVAAFQESLTCCTAPKRNRND